MSAVRVADGPAGRMEAGEGLSGSEAIRRESGAATRRGFLRIFKDYDYVVDPSGSCVAMVRLHFEQYLHGRPGFEELKRKTFELCEFLTDVVKVRKVEGKFPHRVGLHQSCHGLRELRLGAASELVKTFPNKARTLLEQLEGIEFAALSRPDECCGFGGTFAVNEADWSAQSGRKVIPPVEGRRSGFRLVES